MCQFVIYAGLTFMAYLVDVPNDGACFFTCLAYYAQYCEKHSLLKSSILATEPNHVRQRLCDFLLANKRTVMIPDSVNQLTVHQYFLETYGPEAIERKTVHISNACNTKIYCNTIEQYIERMRYPAAHADELFVWAASNMFNLKLSILEIFVPRIIYPDVMTQLVEMGYSKEAVQIVLKEDSIDSIDSKVEQLVKIGYSKRMHEKYSKKALQLGSFNSNLRQLVEMGYSKEAAQIALQQASGELEQAVNFLLQNPPSSESADVWREDVHNKSGTHECKIIRTERHFQLLLPQTVVPKDAEPKLPPRTRKYLVAAQHMWTDHSKGAAAPVEASKDCQRQQPPPQQKPSAGGGGAAAIQHQSPPSFGHMQSPQRPPSFMEKLQSLFPALMISHYFANPVVCSGTYEPTEEDKKTNMCLLASARYDAIASDKTAGPFLYLLPGLTFEDVSKKYRLVTSFDIDKQPYRLVAVVYSDDNIVACPEISSLPEGPPRNELRKSFHFDIKEYLLRNSGTSINGLLFVPCI